MKRLVARHVICLCVVWHSTLHLLIQCIFSPMNCWTSGMMALPGNLPKKPAAAAASPKLLTASPVDCILNSGFIFVRRKAAWPSACRVTLGSGEGGWGMCVNGVFMTHDAPPNCSTWVKKIYISFFGNKQSMQMTTWSYKLVWLQHLMPHDSHTQMNSISTTESILWYCVSIVTNVALCFNILEHMYGTEK